MISNRLVVIIPTHIHYKDQTERLRNCLISLYHQTILVDIIISVSCENNMYEKKFINMMRHFPTVQYYLMKNRFYQMEHILNLLPYVQKYTLVMFCDDDDTYDPDRAKVLFNAYLWAIDKKSVIGVKEIGINEYSSNIQEYYSYAIKPKYLNLFFHRFGKHLDLLKHKFADLYLRNFLRRVISFSFGCIKDDCNKIYYHYTINNPNSICSTIQNDSSYEQIHSKLLSLMIECHPLVHSNESNRIFNTNELDFYFPEWKQVEDVLKDLYHDIEEDDKIIMSTIDKKDLLEIKSELCDVELYQNTVVDSSIM